MILRSFGFLSLFISFVALAQAPVPASPPADSTKLQIISAPKAIYPTEAIQKGIHGVVVVHLTVNEAGTVDNAEVVSGDTALAEVALETAKKWTFQPFIRDGKPIPVATKVTIEFTPLRVRISQGVSEGLVLKKVPPTYPPIAREARIQGSVVLSAVIGADGGIKELKVVSGHPLLAPAAIDAVNHWKYKPYLLQGQPVEVETQITINFTLIR